MSQKQHWEKLYEKKNRYGRGPREFSNTALEWMKKTNGKKVLDLCSGEGRDAIFFAKNGYDVTCLDFSEKAINSCKEDCIEENVSDSVHAIVCDVSKSLKFEDKIFDVVYAHLALHYFNDETTSNVFNEIKRVLKNGGILIIRVKSIKDPVYGLGEKIEEDMYKFQGHIRHFFSKEYLLSKLLNFKILYIEQKEFENPYAKEEIKKTSNFLDAIFEKNKH